MGKAKRVDLGANSQERTNKDAQAQPRYNPGQQFFTRPKKGPANKLPKIDGIIA